MQKIRSHAVRKAYPSSSKNCGCEDVKHCELPSIQSFQLSSEMCGCKTANHRYKKGVQRIAVCIFYSQSSLQSDLILYCALFSLVCTMQQLECIVLKNVACKM